MHLEHKIDKLAGAMQEVVNTVGNSVDKLTCSNMLGCHSHAVGSSDNELDTPSSVKRQHKRNGLPKPRLSDEVILAVHTFIQYLVTLLICLAVKSCQGSYSQHETRVA